MIEQQYEADKQKLQKIRLALVMYKFGQLGYIKQLLFKAEQYLKS